MSFYSKVRAVISLSSIVQNYRTIRRSTNKEIIPVIKADAYGHGLLEVAGALFSAGAKTFAVGTVDEAIALRQNNAHCGIISMFGPIEGFEYEALYKYDILPFIHCFEQLYNLGKFAKFYTKGLNIALKFDTGMRRLGFTLADIPEITRRINGLRKINVTLLSSHLATADVPELEGFVEMQIMTFRQIQQALVENGFNFELSLSNSSATLVHPELDCHKPRVGIILYGVNPLHNTNNAHLCGKLVPAMCVQSNIMAVHKLCKSETISYGCTYRADHDMTVAIVAAGYKDGYSRNLSNSGEMCVSGRRVPIVGRVCLQMVAIDVSNVDVKMGDVIHLLGGEGAGHISIYELSKWWKSIPAEVMSIMGNNKRVFV